MITTVNLVNIHHYTQLYIFLVMRTFNTYYLKFWASLVAQLVKNPLAMQESTCNAGEQGSIPGSRRSPGEGNGNPLQYSCLENPMDREA